jgi:purine-binding chemotaxis protein CheW
MLKRRSNRAASAIQWDKIAQRLSSAAESLDKALAISPEQGRRIMEERARSLSISAGRAKSTAPTLEFLVFGIGKVRYAIETRFVRQVVRMPVCTLVPSTPEILLGLINLGGEVLPVFDLGHLLGSSLQSLGSKSDARAIVLGDDRDRFGVKVDRAIEVTCLAEDEIADAPITGESRRHLLGLAVNATAVLDGHTLLNDAHFFIDQSHRP